MNNSPPLVTVTEGYFRERTPTAVPALKVPPDPHTLQMEDWPDWVRPFLVPYYRCEPGKVMFSPPPSTSGWPPPPPEGWKPSFVGALSQDGWGFERIPEGAWLALIHGGLVRFSEEEFEAHFTEGEYL